MSLKELIPWKKNDHELAVRREPANPFDQFQREMDQLLNSFLAEWPGRTSLLDRRLGSFIPDVDVTETDKEVRVTAELPGLDEKEVEVTLVQGALIIKGEKREEHNEEKGDFHRSECRYGMFERTVQLPNGIDADKAKASFKKGVLKVTLPKTADAQANRKRIAVEG